MKFLGYINVSLEKIPFKFQTNLCRVLGEGSGIAKNSECLELPKTVNLGPPLKTFFFSGAAGLNFFFYNFSILLFEAVYFLNYLIEFSRKNPTERTSMLIFDPLIMKR